MGIPDHLTCLLRNLHAVHEATVRKEHGTMDWCKTGKRVRQALSPAYLTYAEHIMRNARVDESQTGINVAGRNVNNLRYAGDTALMAESEEELKNISMMVKEDIEKKLA